MRRSRAVHMWFIACLLTLGGAGPGVRSSCGQTWQTGDAFRRQLLAPASATWSGTPLRDALESLRQSWQIAIWLDRRVDPDQTLNFAVTDASLDGLLHGLARKLDIGVCYVDSVVYLGPAHVAHVLATVAEQRYDDAERLRLTSFTRRAAMQWEILAEPRPLVEGQLRDVMWTVESIDDLPHDLWPAGSLPPLPLTHRLTLLLAGFDKTFEFDADQKCVRLIPLPEQAELRREYPLRGNDRRKVAEWSRRFPESELRVVGNRLQVVGSAEDHYWIRREVLGLPSPAPRPATPSEVRYTLNTESRFEGLARALAQRLNLTIEFDPGVRAILTRTVTLNVKNATLEQLLQALVDTVGVHYELQGDRLRIVPKP